MATSTVSPQEEANRTRLVAEVLDFLDARPFGWDVEALEALDQDVAGGWDQLAEAMGRKRLFSDKTRAQIVGTARLRESRSGSWADDIYDRLDGGALR